VFTPFGTERLQTTPGTGYGALSSEALLRYTNIDINIDVSADTNIKLFG
jgi:hypothetical protein